MLYWLIGSDDMSFMIISSYYIGERLFSYQINIRWSSKGFTYQINKPELTIPRFGRSKTGTRIRLFTPLEMPDRGDLFDRLEDVDRVKILYSGSLLKERIDDLTKIPVRQINQVQDGPIVFISSSLNGIDVIDNAEGIPLTTVYNSLLVPSSSTKGLRTIPITSKFVNKTRIYHSEYYRDQSRLYITVNDIRVIEMIDKGHGEIYVISLPSTTKLPVARDDVIFDDVTSSIFEEHLYQLAMRAIYDHNNLCYLYNLMDKYSVWSQQAGLAHSWQNVRARVLKRSDVVLIPNTPTYQQIAKYRTDIHFVFYPNPDLVKLEQKLISIFTTARTDIFQFKSVVVIPTLTTDFSTGGLNQLVFVRRLDTDTIISKCTEFVPLPFGISLSEQIERRIFYMSSNPTIRETYFILYLTLSAVFENVKCDIYEIISHMTDHFKLYAKTDDDTIEYLRNLIGKMSQIKLRYPYGCEPLIQFNTKNVLLTAPLGLKEKFLSI